MAESNRVIFDLHFLIERKVVKINWRKFVAEPVLEPTFETVSSSACASSMFMDSLNSRAYSAAFALHSLREVLFRHMPCQELAIKHNAHK